MPDKSGYFSYIAENQIPMRKREILYFLKHRGFTNLEISNHMRIREYVLEDLYLNGIPENITRNNFQYANYKIMSKYINEMLEIRDQLRIQENKQKLDDLVQED